MHLVRHDYERMQGKMAQNVGIVLNGFHDHLREFRAAKVTRPSADFFEQSIHGGECLS